MPRNKTTVTVTFKPIPVEYKITLAPVTGASVNLSAKKAAEGEEITVTVNPKSGHELESITAKDLVNTILCTGFQHHFPVIKGDYTAEIKEFAAWLGLAPIKKIPYADYLQVID